MKAPFLDFKKQPKKTLVVILGLFGFTFLLLHPAKEIPSRWTVFSKHNEPIADPQVSPPNPIDLYSSPTKETNNDYVSSNEKRSTKQNKLPAEDSSEGEVIAEAIKQFTARHPLPPPLSSSLLYPHLHHIPGNANQEIFINFDIKMQGFLVPGAYIRTMLFMDESSKPKISFLDYDWNHLPPTESFSIKISGAEAVSLAQRWENEPSPIWRIKKEWRYYEKKWSPNWNIRLRGSQYTYFVDVRSGHISRVHSAQGIDDLASKTIQFVGIANKLYGGPSEFETFPLPLLKTETASSSTLMTDEKGMLDTPLPLETLSLSLKNPMIVVKDKKDEGIQFKLSESPRLDKVIFNPESTPHQTAMLNVFLAVTSVYQFLFNEIKLTKPNDCEPVEAWVNIDYQDCNAKYRNGIIAFYDESEQCRNTAYDTVVYHEYAHYIDDLFGGITDSALSEGLGDLLATFMSQQPLIGQKLYKKDLFPLRSAENNVQFQREPKNQELTVQAYTNAQAFSGFAWDVRQKYIEKYGREDGQQKVIKLFFPLFETNPPNMWSAVKELVARSKNGSPEQSSTDSYIVKRAANRHGFL